MASLSGRSALPPRRARSRPERAARGGGAGRGQPVVDGGGATKCTARWPPARWAPNIGRGSTGCGVGIDALASPICAHAIMPPFSTTEGARRRTRAPTAPGRRACRARPNRPRGRGRGRAGQMVYFAMYRGTRWLSARHHHRRERRAGLHHVRGLPGPHHHLADAAHRLSRCRSSRWRRCRAAGPRPRWSRADPALGERQVLRHLGVEVVADHQHVEVFVEGVDGVWPGRVGRTKEDVRQVRPP